jgi:hypothetical protein
VTISWAGYSDKQCAAYRQQETQNMNHTQRWLAEVYQVFDDVLGVIPHVDDGAFQQSDPLDEAASTNCTQS